MEQHRVRYIRMQADVGDAERERVRKTDLYKIGDTIAVWVNEGDLCIAGECLDPREPTIVELKAENEQLRQALKPFISVPFAPIEGTRAASVAVNIEAIREAERVLGHSH